MSEQVTVPVDLICRLRHDDESAFRAIYDMLHNRIYRMLYTLVKQKEQTEELVQETFVILWLNRKKLVDTQPLYPYIYLIAKRLAIDHFRKKLLDSNVDEHVKTLSNEYKRNSTEETVSLKELVRCLHEAVDLLPQQQRTVYRLSRERCLSYAEIAVEMKLSPNTVKNHLVNALKALKSHFKKNHIMTFFMIIHLFNLTCY